MRKMLTRDQRHRLVERTRKEEAKKIEKLQKENEKLLMKKEKEKKNQYPPTILTMMKRIKRIDPWSTIVNLSSFDASLIVYYKLKQKGLGDIRFVVTAKHCWVEFKFDEKWYIFDILAVRKPEFGSPIRLKYDAEHEFYNDLVRYYDIDEFLEKFDDKLSYTSDEARIAAMEDENLGSVLIIKYH